MSADVAVVRRFIDEVFNGGRLGGSLGKIHGLADYKAFLRIAIYTVSAGKITEAWFGEDVLGMMLQLGVVELPMS